MGSAQYTAGRRNARRRALGVGRVRGSLAALAACCVQAAAFSWGLPFPCDASPDALWPLRSMLSVERWPSGELSPDKYPEAFHLLAGGFEHAAALLLLDAEERAQIRELRERLEELLRARRADPEFDVQRELNERGAALVPALSRLVAAGRAATLLLSFLLGFAAAEVANACAGPRFGWIAALSLGLMPATVHYGATLNVDVPALAWCAAAWALAVKAARGAAALPFLACGAAMGLAAATKDPAVAVLPGVLCFALRRLRGDPMPRLRRLPWIAAGAAAGYALTSGLLSFPTWREHVRFILGAGSQPYREFPLTAGGVLGLLKSAGDRFLAAGGLVGGAGVVLLLVTAGTTWRLRALRLLLPAASYALLFLVPAGYVYPRFTLPLCLCGAVALAWALAHVPGGGMARRQRAWLGGLVALGSAGEASGVIDAKWSDVRPPSVEALAGVRAPGDVVWVCAEPAFFSPFPPIDPPVRHLSLHEVGRAMKQAQERPSFLWLAVDPHLPIAGPAALEATATRLGLKLLHRFETSARPPLARDRNGLLLPTVALFGARAK
jgi:hypothetical protein